MRKLVIRFALLLTLLIAPAAAQAQFPQRITSSTTGTSETNFSVLPWAQHETTAGMLVFRWLTGGNSPTNCDDANPPVMFVVTRLSPTGIITDLSGGPNPDGYLLAQQIINCNNAGGQFAVQFIRLPGVPTTEFNITYEPNGVTSGTYELTLVYLPADYANALVSFMWPPRTSTGTWTQPSALLVGSFGITKHTFEIEVSGGPTACTISMEGSNADWMNFSVSPHNWFDLTGPLDCTSSRIVHVIDKPVGMIRPKVATLSGGTTPAVQVWYVGSR